MALSNIGNGSKVNLESALSPHVRTTLKVRLPRQAGNARTVGPSLCSHAIRLRLENLDSPKQTSSVVRDDILVTTGAVIVGFGVAAFVFRIQRELQQGDAGYVSWIPWADRLLVGVVTVALLLVLFPIALAGGDSRLWVAGRLPAAACSGAVVALAGYIPALLAHYRFGLKRLAFGQDPQQAARLVRDARGSQRKPGEPVERVIVGASAVLGVVAMAVSIIVTS
jgi:hypothetical protein